MAEPNVEAQPDAPDEPDASVQIPEMVAPDQHVLNGFRFEVKAGPMGGRFLVLHCFNRGEMLLMDFSEDSMAEQLCQELKPSRVARIDDAETSEAGIVLP
jgi:hypothetical protein